MRVLMLTLLGSVLCLGQAADECRPSTLNIPGAQYPCVYPDQRATFRLVAPDAQKVQVRVGKTFDMAKGPDGAWTVTTTPLVEGFHYYSLIVEFPVHADWMHNSEGIQMFNNMGLMDPYDPIYQHRVRRFAGFYMNEDPGAPNYDPVHKLIRSTWNGSRGPVMRPLTSVDWVGDPSEIRNRYGAGHGEESYEEMLFHYKDYYATVGDHPLNLLTTNLAVNAYILTGEAKYRDWLLEYVDAWVDRMKANGGVIPSNVGLTGRSAEGRMESGTAAPMGGASPSRVRILPEPGWRIGLARFGRFPVS